ncbi:hypothetical protein U5640_33715 [Streptomyces sp. SS7]|uniref:hypothetical protein n=1 Tax=Streptomyces sp. SS7 TaxID=3108485 RepID=UPI0030ED200B
MGIRTHHRRTARTRGPATADTQGDRDPAPPRRRHPALAPGASTARVPGHRRGTGAPATPRLWAEQTRAYLSLALATLGRAHRRKPARRISVFVATPPSLSARPDGSAPR